LTFTISDDYLEFMGLNQGDAKMKLPEFIYTISIPYYCKNWYSKIEEVLIQKVNELD